MSSIFLSLSFNDQWHVTYATVYAEHTPLREVAYAGYSMVLTGACASLRGVGFAYAAMGSFCFWLWHEALEPHTTDIIANQGKMNEFKLLPTSVYTKATLYRLKRAYANAYATYSVCMWAQAWGRIYLMEFPLYWFYYVQKKKYKKTRYSETLKDSNRWDHPKWNSCGSWIRFAPRIPQGRTVSQTTSLISLGSLPLKLHLWKYLRRQSHGSVSKPCTPVVHIKIAGIYGCSSP